MKRGANAWINVVVRSLFGSTKAGNNPLLVHVVGDAAILRQYLPSFKKLLDWSDEKKAEMETVLQVEQKSLLLR